MWGFPHPRVGYWSRHRHCRPLPSLLLYLSLPISIYMNVCIHLFIDEYNWDPNPTQPEEIGLFIIKSGPGHGQFSTYLNWRRFLGEIPREGIYCHFIWGFYLCVIKKNYNYLQAIKKFEFSQVPLVWTYLSSTPFRPLGLLTVSNRWMKRWRVEMAD